MSDLSFFLKTLKPQPKQEWNEENEKLVKNLISTLSNLYARNLIEKETKEKYTNWLKSLRPQNRWKPSEYSLNSLSDAIIRFEGQGINAIGIKELLEQLKKLTE